MNDLIDRAALLKSLEYNPLKRSIVQPKSTFGIILSAPAVDAVEVVRCKDCKHCIKDKMLCTHPRNLTFRTGLNVLPTHFCSYGEMENAKE